ncbi:hypothetical protein AB1Y20_014084 [Prymnesium parvum]
MGNANSNTEPLQQQLKNLLPPMPRPPNIQFPFRPAEKPRSGPKPPVECTKPAADAAAAELGLLTKELLNAKNNILLMTDGYKFSHHKQYPVSWMPKHAREAEPPIFFPAFGDLPGTVLLKLHPVPAQPGDAPKVTFVTNVSTVVAAVVQPLGSEPVDIVWRGKPVTYLGGKKEYIVMKLDDATRDALRLPSTHTIIKLRNLDESKVKRGSVLNETFEGGYNVSYFTSRAYKDQFEGLDSDGNGDHIVFFGLQYFIKEYLMGEVVTREKIEAADVFVARYMADVRFQGPTFAQGYDHTMFPRGDWEAMLSGDYDCTGEGVPERAGRLPIKIEALPEGSLVQPGVCMFKLTNTHPRFFWLPNFLETLLVQIWYPTTVATQSREFRKTIQAYSILSQRVSPMPPELGKPEFTVENVYEDNLSIHVAQVADLLDFGYRGVSSHETACLGSAAYYASGFECSDTVAGSRMLLERYNGRSSDAPEFLASFGAMFEQVHCATSVPAAGEQTTYASTPHPYPHAYCIHHCMLLPSHSTITSWADMAPDSDAVLYEKAEYHAFCNMFKQYMSAFAVSLVSDGFNIWNAVANHWPCEEPAQGAPSMRAMLRERLDKGLLSLVRPDSGEGVETLPQLLTILRAALPEMFEEGEPMRAVFDASDARAAKYAEIVTKLQKKLGMPEGANPFRRCKGQQFRVLQGDGVALDTVGDMCASLLANGFCVNTVNFGSGGGLLQKLNRDSLSCAFKCCAMYVNGKMYAIGKDPIAGGKKSYPGNPAVIRGEDGVLRNRGVYDAKGKMVLAQPLSADEFHNGVKNDELVTIFKDGEVLVDQSFFDIKSRVTIKNLDSALSKAVDNLALKLDFLQTMTSKEAIAVRLAEASCGSKWMHKHATKLDDMSAKFAELDLGSTFTSLGLTSTMDSEAVLAHIKENLMCDKKATKTVLASINSGDIAAAKAAKGTKAVLTL